MGATPKIEPLPSDLSGLSREQGKQAYDVRRERMDELGNLLDTDHEFTSDEAAEMKQLRVELERLQEPLPHPGHPRPKGGGSGGRKIFGGIEFGRIEGLGSEFVKNVGGPNGLKAFTGGAVVPAFFDPRILGLPQRSMFVRSVIPTSSTSSDTVQYVRQTVFTNNAAPVAVGAQKPKSVLTIERVETSVRTIAHVTEALDRALLSDYNQVQAFIDQQLRLGLLLAEENQIINGDGTAPNISGILDQPSIQTQAKGADPTPDAFYKAMTKIRLNAFAEPDAIVMHPNDWQQIRLLTTADGLYIAAPMVETDPDRFWGKELITSPVIAEGTGLVGAFGTGAQIWDREQARVDFTESGLGDTAGHELFDRNQVRFRGEERLAFGVLRPLNFRTVTGI